MREIVFDIETYGDIKNREQLKVTMVSIYEYATQQFRSFEEHQLNELWPILEKAERLIGYNSKFFDVPILNKYYTGNLLAIPHLDILEKIKESSGKRYKLDEIARATLTNIKKSADGLQAQTWFEQGEIDKIREYCEQDVLVTKEVYEFGRKNRMLYYPTLTGEVLPIGINFEPETTFTSGVPAGNNINLTLPL